MITTKNEIESLVLGRAVLEIRGFQAEDDFPGEEKRFRQEHDPLYAVCKVPVEDLRAVHQLEDNGFRFIETQLKLSLKMKSYDASKYPYSYVPVEPGDLETVLNMAETIFSDDRFSIDPFIKERFAGKAAGERYRRYVMKSFEAPDECVYKMVNDGTKEIVGFGTHRHTTQEEAVIFIGGIVSTYQKAGLGPISDFLAINNLRREGVKKAYTHVSARNYAIMNLEIAGLGYKVMNSHVVLRKVYE
jgi:hypothetical protein